MPKIRHVAMKDWECGECHKLILKGTLYRWWGKVPWRLSDRYRVHPRCHPHSIGSTRNAIL